MSLLVEQVANGYEGIAMPDLLNPRATIGEVSPIGFRPGDRIDLRVKYTPANDEESAWQTVVVVKRGTQKLVMERQKHLSMHPGQITANCDTGLSMPSTPTGLTIEIWAHPDYGETSWPST